eukprot:4860605-Pleurochrysis_carterae.AAC.1
MGALRGWKCVADAMDLGDNPPNGGKQERNVAGLAGIVNRGADGAAAIACVEDALLRQEEGGAELHARGARTEAKVVMVHASNGRIPDRS